PGSTSDSASSPAPSNHRERWTRSYAVRFSSATTRRLQRAASPRSNATCTKRWPTMPLPTTINGGLSQIAGSLGRFIASLCARAGQTGQALAEQRGPRVTPPRGRDARQVERHEALEGEQRRARRLDRGAEAARNEVAAERSDRGHDADHGCGLAPRRLKCLGLRPGTAPVG